MILIFHCIDESVHVICILHANERLLIHAPAPNHFTMKCKLTDILRDGERASTRGEGKEDRESTGAERMIAREKEDMAGNERGMAGGQEDLTHAEREMAGA